MRINIKAFLILLHLLTLCGCATGGRQDYQALAVREQEKVASWDQLDAGQTVTILNDLIQSSELDILVDKALEANPSLQQTLITLRIRQADIRKTGAELWPQASADLSAQKEKDSDILYACSMSVSWQLDLWGKLSDSRKSAVTDAAAQKALYQSARDTLASQVMINWLGLTAAARNMEIEQQRLYTLEKTLAFVLERYRNGLGTLEDLDSARSALASSKASLEEYKETLAVQQRSLATLIGRPQTLVDVPETYAAVLIPLVDLPEQTLQRRPDLKAAFLAIESSVINTRVAYKELLPGINLQAAFEDAASDPGASLLRSPVWSLLGQLTAPLFQGGKLKAAADIAELKTAQAYQAYRETLHNAVQEIENAVGQERSLTQQISHIKEALSSSENSLGQYQQSYRQGLADILDILSVQRQTYDLDIQLNNLIYQRLVNRVTLGLVLGLGVK